MVPTDVEAFGTRVAQRLTDILGNDLVGAYFVGSVALSGYVSGESDVDVLAVCEHAIPGSLKEAIASDLSDETATCPARGLEFTLYRRQVATSVPREADFEVNVNGGPRMDRLVHRIPDKEPSFWYVLDRAIAHRDGVVISGPPAADVVVDAPRPVVLDALRASIRWHQGHEQSAHQSVLNAARAWRFAAEDVLGSKLDGAQWARPRWRSPSVIDAAVGLRHRRPAVLNNDQVDEFLRHVARVMAAAT
jgi:hypothetical protein